MWSISEMDNPRIKANNLTLPLKEPASDPYSFLLNLTGGSNAPELVMHSAVDVVR